MKLGPTLKLHESWVSLPWNFLIGCIYDHKHKTPQKLYPKSRILMMIRIWLTNDEAEIVS